MLAPSEAVGSPRSGASLLSLPFEIRAAIYRTVFSNFHVVWHLAHLSYRGSVGTIPSHCHLDGPCECAWTDSRGQQPGTFALATAITRTCRLCREESLSLLKQGGTHCFDFNLLLNIPIGHPFFDTASRRHVVIRQKSRQDIFLESTQNLLVRFPNLSTLRVILPDIHAASLRGYGTFENLIRNAKLRARLLQLIEHQTFINTFVDQSSYAIGESLRDTIEKYAESWRPEVHIQGRIDLPRSGAAHTPGPGHSLRDPGNRTIEDILNGAYASRLDELRFLTYSVNVVTGEKLFTSDDGMEFRLAEFRGASEGVTRSMRCSFKEIMGMDSLPIWTRHVPIQA
jgi:hypothetical protein